MLATLADRYGRVTVMLVAGRRSRRRCSSPMLLDVPVGVLLVLAFLAGLATPPFEAARSAALPDLVPEDRYRDALALSGISVQFSLVLGYALGGLLLTVVDPEAALAINACSFLVSAAAAPRAAQQRRRPSGIASARRSCARSATGPPSLFGDRMVRRALVFVSVTGALGTVDEALVVPYADAHRSARRPPRRARGRRSPSARCWPPWSIAGGRRDHHSLLRTAAWCGVVTSALAAPLFWFEASGALAFLAFAISGGMFAVSIPTNAVIGLRLSRDTRASAMGIAVGVLMGSQALGAALGGIAASVVGSPRAIGGALAAAAVFSLWAVVTTPADAKHLAVAPSARAALVVPIVAPWTAPSRRPTRSSTSWPWRRWPPSSRRPGSGEPSGRGVRIPGHDASAPSLRRPSSPPLRAVLLLAARRVRVR